MKVGTLFTAIAAICCLIGCSVKTTTTVTTNGKGKAAKPYLVTTLPTDSVNCPDGCTLDAAGNIILSIPNFNNKALKQDLPAYMVSISKDNKVSTWYEFKPEDLHPDTKKVGPMDCAFGPDGNLYLADNQLFYNNKHKSRILRINVTDGKAVSCNVVVEGFICSNGMCWNGNNLYVSETQLVAPVPPKDGEKKAPLISGVYGFTLDEMTKGVVKLSPYSADSKDPHLVAEYKTSGRIGFGADGVCCDEEGNMYCGIFEDGIIFKTTFKDGKPQPPVEFARDKKMKCCDGIVYRKKDKKIYVADMLINGIQAVSPNGKVETIHTNGDTDGADGSLDQPCEVMMRGAELIVINMDMPWDSPLLTNKKIDKPYTVSAIKLP